MPLTQIIIDKIKREGPICFKDFMETALYYPQMGYYMSPGNKIGKAGDFYTSSCLSPVFGVLIGKQLEEMWERLGGGDFTIVEFGAGTGNLCYHILRYVKGNGNFYKKLHYCIIEKSPVMRELERTHLHGAGFKEKITWHEAVEDLKGFEGCVLSNELVDNFSVHQVVMQEDLMEVWVDHQSGFRELYEQAPPALKHYLAELEVRLPSGFRTEINLNALDWLHDVSVSLKKGFVLTIDYGYSSAELYADQRKRGTLLCYSKHSVDENPYVRIGEQDITSHVNFSALHHWGKKNDLQTCGYLTQANFLLGLGLEDYFSQLERRRQKKRQQARASDVEGNYPETEGYDIALKHTLLFGMGLKVKVMVQQKGMDKEPLSVFANGRITGNSVKYL